MTECNTSTCVTAVFKAFSAACPVYCPSVYKNTLLLFSCSSFDTKKRPTGSFRSPIRTFFPVSDIFFRADYCGRNVLSLNEAVGGGTHAYVCITRNRWRMYSRVFNSGRKWDVSRCCPERKVSPAANMLTAVFLSALLMLWASGGAEASDLRVSGKSIHTDKSLSDSDGRHSVRKQLHPYQVRAGCRFVLYSWKYISIKQFFFIKQFENYLILTF